MEGDVVGRFAVDLSFGPGKLTKDADRMSLDAVGEWAVLQLSSQVRPMRVVMHVMMVVMTMVMVVTVTVGMVVAGAVLTAMIVVVIMCVVMCMARVMADRCAILADLEALAEQNAIAVIDNARDDVVAKSGETNGAKHAVRLLREGVK